MQKHAPNNLVHVDINAKDLIAHLVIVKHKTVFLFGSLNGRFKKNHNCLCMHSTTNSKANSKKTYFS